MNNLPRWRVLPTADPVRVGHIGTGTRGWDLIKYTGGTDSAKVVAVCGVYKPHLRRGAEAAGNPSPETRRAEPAETGLEVRREPEDS